MDAGRFRGLRGARLEDRDVARVGLLPGEEPETQEGDRGEAQPDRRPACGVAAQAPVERVEDEQSQASEDVQLPRGQPARARGVESQVGTRADHGEGCEQDDGARQRDEGLAPRLNDRVRDREDEQQRDQEGARQDVGDERARGGG